MPSRSPSGERMQRPEPANTEQRKAPTRALRREVPCGPALHSWRLFLSPSASSPRLPTRSLLTTPEPRPTTLPHRQRWPCHRMNRWLTVPSPPDRPVRTCACRSNSTPDCWALASSPRPAGQRRTLRPSRSGGHSRQAGGGTSGNVPPPPPRRRCRRDPWIRSLAYERAAWEQVAMCEEGGNWESDGSSLQRRPRHQPSQLGRLRRTPVRPRGSRSHRGRADHGGRTHPVRPARSGRLQRLVIIRL